jgi:hypothetical protein
LPAKKSFKEIKRFKRLCFSDSEPDVQSNSYIEVLALRIGKLRTKVMCSGIQLIKIHIQFISLKGDFKLVSTTDLYFKGGQQENSWFRCPT